ncbi:MAG: M28 family peptidase [Stappiaceae bacterium]
MDLVETELLTGVSADEPWALVESFAGFKREHPDGVNRGMDEVASRLAKHGVPVRMHEPDLYLSLPGVARVEANGQTFRAKPPAYSVDARNGLSGELVHITVDAGSEKGDAFEAQFEASPTLIAKVSGKLVISEGFASPALVSLLESCGATGVIAINPGVDVHWGICTTIWGIPGASDLPKKPGIAAVAVNRPDGDALIKLAQENATVTIFTEMEEGWFKSKLPEVTIEGTEEPDKYVLLHGHLDSWDVGVGDNATGDATMLEVARVLWANRHKLRRSVKICWWPGHSTGRYAGSTWYADTFALDLDANCVAQVNCDSPGCRGATEFLNVSLMSEAQAFLSDIVGEVADKPLHGERPHRAGDYSFNGIGLSSYFMLSSAMTYADREAKGYYPVGGCGMNIAWHTENDTLEIADKDILLRDIKVYLLAVFRNANALILPFDWRLTVKEFQETLAGYQSDAGDLFDLSPTKSALASLMISLEKFYADAQKGTISAAAANAVIQDLARILVPLNFNRGPRFQHDPALTIPPLPALEQATKIAHYPADVLGFARTELVRGQNAVIAGLRQAERHIQLVVTSSNGG